MSKQDILKIFYDTSSSLTPVRMIILLLIALVGGLIIYAIYFMTCRRNTYNREYNEGNVILTLVTTVIMMMISSNVVISLGMVGALSIVRFRTAVKNARDTLFFFWAIVLGLSVGSQNLVLAAISTVFIAIVVLMFSLITYKREKYTLIIRAKGDCTKSIESILSQNTKTYKMLANNSIDGFDEGVYLFVASEEGAKTAAKNVRELKEVSICNLINSGI